MTLEPYYRDQSLAFYHGDVIETLRKMPADSIHTVITSPPYYALRDYGTATWDGGDQACDHKRSTARGDGGRVNTNGFHGSATEDSDKGAMNYASLCGKCGAKRVDQQIGLEETPEAFITKMVEVFREVRRVLRNDGTCWVNIGDSYAAGGNGTQGKNGLMADRSIQQARIDRSGVTGLKPKDLIGIPWMLAFALRADGWWLRQDIIWSKPNPMPESVTDRCTKAHEYLFLLTKSKDYYYDVDAMKEPSPAGGTPAGYSGYGARARAMGREPSGNEKDGAVAINGSFRNKRSVWTISTEPQESYAVYGDSGRKVSPDCPVHGDLGRRASTDQYDGQPGASQIERSQRNDADLYPAPLLVVGGEGGYAVDGEGGSDWPHQSYEDAAMHRSKETHKTALSRATEQHEIHAASLPSHTAHIEQVPVQDAIYDRSRGSSSEVDSDVDETEPYQQAGTKNHNERKCTCAYDTATTRHFAAFPTALVRPCIKAGTSEHGCCKQCRAPWERQVEIIDPNGRLGASYHDHQNDLGVGQRGVPAADGAPTRKTVGWAPGCTCGADVGVVPCTVLDPFIGSGTTGYVAKALGRRAVGIDLSAEYLDLAVRRCSNMVDSLDIEEYAKTDATKKRRTRGGPTSFASLIASGYADGDA